MWVTVDVKVTAPITTEDYIKHIIFGKDLLQKVIGAEFKMIQITLSVISRYL